MNIILYMDVSNGYFDPKFAMAVANPSPKIDGYIRYAISIDIMDPNKPDVVLTSEVKDVVDEYI